MKLLMPFLISSLFSSVVLADIKIGETYTYHEKLDSRFGNSFEAFVDYTILDQQTDMVYVSQYKINNYELKKWLKREEVDGSNAYNSTQIHETCKKKMGQLELLQTKNYSILTCKVNQYKNDVRPDGLKLKVQQTTWFGPVLNNGIVRYLDVSELENGTRTIYTKELISIQDQN